MTGSDDLCHCAPDQAPADQPPENGTPPRSLRQERRLLALKGVTDGQQTFWCVAFAHERRGTGAQSCWRCSGRLNQHHNLVIHRNVEETPTAAAERGPARARCSPQRHAWPRWRVAPLPACWTGPISRLRPCRSVSTRPSVFSAPAGRISAQCDARPGSAAGFGQSRLDPATAGPASIPRTGRGRWPSPAPLIWLAWQRAYYAVALRHLSRLHDVKSTTGTFRSRRRVGTWWSARA